MRIAAFILLVFFFTLKGILFIPYVFVSLLYYTLHAVCEFCRAMMSEKKEVIQSNPAAGDSRGVLDLRPILAKMVIKKVVDNDNPPNRQA